MRLLTGLRRGVRRLRDARAFTAVAVATVALATAVLGTVTAIGKALFVDPLPYPHADRLVLVQGERRLADVEPWPLGVLDLEDLARGSRALDGPVPVASGRALSLRIDDAVGHFEGELVGAGYFELLGLRPAAGRFFTREEAASREVGVAILSWDTWERHFGGDPRAVGQVVAVNDRPAQVVGVAPRAFHGISDGADLWLPIGSAAALYQPAYLDVRMFRWLGGVARLGEGTDLAAATAEADAAFRALESELPKEYAGLHVVLEPLAEVYFGDLRKPVTILLWAAGLVLAVASSNLALLVLVRGLGRRQLVAVQRALGAGTRAILGAATVEVAVLVVAGGLLGLAAAHWIAPALLGSAGIAIPRHVRGGVDLGVAAITLVTCLVAGVLFAAGPAWSTASVDPAMVLRETPRGGSVGAGRRRLLGALVAAQAALALVLLVAAGLLGRGLLSHLETDLGFRDEKVTAMRVALPAERYGDDGRYVAFAETLVERARALPGVREAALEGPGYPTYGSYGLSFWNDQVPGGPETWTTLKHHVTPGYFETLGIRVVSGRGFTSADRGEAGKVVVVSEELARLLWPGQDPIGRSLRVAQGEDDLALRVVGVVADVRHEGLEQDETFGGPHVYLSLLAYPPRTPPMVTLLAYGDRSAEALASGLRESLKAADPLLPPVEIRALEDAVRDQSARSRLLVAIMGGFAAITALLAAIGIYGAVAHAVEQSGRDLCVRLALGATAPEVARLVLKQGLLPVLAGVGAGLAVTPALHDVLASQLFGIGPRDPVAFAGAAGLLVLVGLIAAAVPSVRAARSDVRDALR